MEEKESEDELNIPDLVDFFSQLTYHTTIVHSSIDGIENKCRQLFEKDYNVELLNNQGGELCGHYPRHLLIPTTYKECSPVEITPDMKELVHKARLARCRSRFPAPVIIYKDKFVCRSATLATTAEILGRSGIEWLQGTWDDYSSEWETCDKLREADKELLNYNKVKHIFDMMVENKKVKFGVSITSSEKADKEKRYCDFELYSVPYPGTEFFTEFRSKHMCAEEMYFDWDQAFVNAQLKLPNTPIVNDIPLCWSAYKDWNLVELTDSYMLLLIKCLGDGEGGLLLHCISGWDRTPLFVSLLRLSLWADGAIHQNLSPKEILYLTIAYDWLLFGHQLEDRLSKQEDIFLFCFHYLQHLKSDKFSIHRYQEKSFRTDEVFNTERVDCNGNIMRCNSSDSFTDTACSSNYTNNSTVNGDSGCKRSSSPATLMLDEKQLVNRSRQSTAGSSNSSSNTNHVNHSGFTNGATTGQHAKCSNGLYDNTQPHDQSRDHPIHPPDDPATQNYRGSSSSIDSWFMVSGSAGHHNGHLDKIMESKRLQKLDAVYKYFGEAFTYLVTKGTISHTCSTSWSTMIGQLADSVSKVTFGGSTARSTLNEECRNSFEMVAMNSFNGNNQSIT